MVWPGAWDDVPERVIRSENDRHGLKGTNLELFWYALVLPGVRACHHVPWLKSVHCKELA